jgi:aspartyl protease family protein
MVVATWLLLLALLTLLFSQWLERRNNPNRVLKIATLDGGATTVVLKRNPDGHYLAPGRINGVDVTFLLDTGATYVAVSSSVAKKAGLSRDAPAQSSTANGVVHSWLTRIDKLQLGPIEMRDVKATILPSMPGYEALLGMSFLKHLSLKQQDGELMISPPL